MTLDSDHRRALVMLAGSPDGITENALTANGFSIELLVDLVSTGLASTRVERVRAGRREIAVTRVRITGAGRRALGITP
jgi:hypothetical protein